MQQLEHWPIDKLIEYGHNPRVNDHAIADTAAAIKEFGFRVPIIAKSDGMIVDGHLRLKAARALGLETVPVFLADDMSDAQIKAFRLSVNRIADLADWNVDLLRTELQDLSAIEYDLDLLAFDDDFLNEVLEVEAPDQPDAEAGGGKPEKTAKEKRYAIVLSKELAEKAKTLGANNVGAGVRLALSKYQPPKKRGRG